MHGLALMEDDFVAAQRNDPHPPDKHLKDLGRQLGEQREPAQMMVNSPQVIHTLAHVILWQIDRILRNA